MFDSSALRNFALGVATVVVICGVAPADAKPEVDSGKRIVIVHTNDLHGNLDSDSKGRGGLTKIASLLAKIRAENPGSVLYLDAGDVAQGTPISNSFQGEPMYVALDYMDPAAGTLGNHEFDWGTKVTDNIVNKAGYPILAANIVDTKTGRHPFRPYRIVRVDGIKVGIIGLVSEETPSVVKKGNTGNLLFQEPAVAAKQYIPRMRNDGAELIVAVSHCGVDADKVLASQVPAIDLIVGGHSHTKLDEAINVGGHTWIVQADKYGRQLGVVEMMVDQHNGKILNFKSRLVQIDGKSGIEADPKVQEIVNKYDAKIRPVMEQVVGKTAADMTKTYDAAKAIDCSLGNVICDALRAKSGADAAVYNYGGIRDDSMPGGVINRGTIFKILPFDDQVVTVKLKGSDLLKLMDEAASMPTGALQVSGIEANLDLAAKKASDVKVNGKPVDPNADYTVATTEFLSGGQDGYTALGKGTLVARFDLARDVFIDYLNDQEVLQVPAGGRMIVTNPAKAVESK